MEAVNDSPEKQVNFNIHVHDQIAKRYEIIHGEIFNDIEQSRLHRSLKNAIGKINSTSSPIKALDYGCGSGNLTRHLLNLNLVVTAADISENFLKLVNHRYHSDRLTTLKLNGKDHINLESNSFDFIALYSVLHHVPDYLAAIKELGRICKPGGVIYFDHENNGEFWSDNLVYKEFRREALKIDWKKYLRFSNYFHRAQKFFNPKHSNEGDIHVWPDDHIEWGIVEEVLTKMNFEVIIKEDYLLYNKLYDLEIYKKFENQCTDMRLMAFRKLLE